MTETKTVETVAVAEEKLSDSDKHALETVILKRRLAIAESEKAELAHNHIVLQLYMKYNMNVETDAIDENGVIKRNAIQKKA